MMHDAESDQVNLIKLKMEKISSWSGRSCRVCTCFLNIGESSSLANCMVAGLSNTWKARYGSRDLYLSPIAGCQTRILEMCSRTRFNRVESQHQLMPNFLELSSAPPAEHRIWIKDLPIEERLRKTLSQLSQSSNLVKARTFYTAERSRIGGE